MFNISFQVDSSKKIGKGVIYKMIDEHNNECPYDFKNIVYPLMDEQLINIKYIMYGIGPEQDFGDFRRTFRWTSRLGDWVPVAINSGYLKYTFHREVECEDLTINNLVHFCEIKEHYSIDSDKMALNRIVFRGGTMWSITVNKGCVSIMINFSHTASQIHFNKCISNVNVPYDSAHYFSNTRFESGNYYNKQIPYTDMNEAIQVIAQKSNGTVVVYNPADLVS